MREEIMEDISNVPTEDVEIQRQHTPSVQVTIGSKEFNESFALASLHSAYLLLDAALQKYALQIHQRNPEAFTNLVQGKDKTEAGIVLLASKIKVNINKLPKV
jgi:hypothetical protein